MPIYLTEVGMSYTGSSIYNGGILRTIWEALRLINTVKNQSAGFIGAWNEADDSHGLHSGPTSGYQRRPAAHLYHLWNEVIAGSAYPVIVTGDTVPVVSSTPVIGVQALATQRADGKKVMVIVNRSELDRSVRVQHSGWVPSSDLMLNVSLVTAQGMQSTQISYANFAVGYDLPRDSVAFVSTV
jgi:hypothetical protein